MRQGGTRAMQRSTDRILTTHTGSLPRPRSLVELMFTRESGGPVDASSLEAEVRSAVNDVVSKQRDAGVDVLNDGEMSKIGYSTYVKERLTGFGGTKTMAQAMREKYTAMARAGMVLQLDCPALARGRHIQFGQASLQEFRRQAALNVEALNFAVSEIPPEQLRMHLCWGNYEGPHHRDVPLRDIIDIVLSARPSAISLEACNPRHEHEWQVFEEVRLPEGKVLIPGVIDSTNNYIEHPDLVAQRLERYAQAVGRDNVMAGSDCGFGTFAGLSTVDPDITWAKFRSMAEGARLASERLWARQLTPA